MQLFIKNIVPCICVLLAGLLHAKVDYSESVNVFLGSNSSAQCSPAAIRPFGMISPGPLNWPQAPCGYQNRINDLIGFNHTHLQGTGCGSYGILVLLPTTGNKELGTKVAVPAARQTAEPGYFAAEITSMGIDAEMTCTARAAIHRYRFPKSDSARVLVDLNQGVFYCGKADISGKLKQHGKRALSGEVTTTAWGEHTTWFYLEFNKPFELLDRGEQGGIASFSTEDGEAVLVKVGISYVSSANARLNALTEIPHWDFDKVRAEAKAEWNAQLGKFEVAGGTPDQQVNFYTAVYHSMFHPQLTSDVNNEYRGLDGKVHTTTGHGHYSVLSTWDTFRAAHPLYTLVAPDLQLDVIKTMLDDFRDSGWGPRWKLGTKEVFCMPGSWADVIISDAYIKGITDFDTEAAWDLVYKNATVAHDGSRGRRDNLGDYLKYGYVTFPNYINVAKTLEHAYCDFNIGKFAKALGKKDEAKVFFEKAQNYKKLWDPETRFFRGKDKDGNWSYPDDFNPFTYTGKGNNDYCEGNAWQWSWHVMQDTHGLIKLMGGKKAFEARLDEFLTAHGGDSGGHNTSSKIFGQYWHGNEPDQHALYAYNYAGAPAKTAKWVRKVLENEYRNDTWGISGNEDAGQMSAWYIFSAMGFYPYMHSVPEYTIGSPIFDEVKLHLPNGNTCVLRAKNNSAENMYIQSIKIDGKRWNKSWLPHSALVEGSTIEFEMGPKPSKWGTSFWSRPYSLSR
jgi:predicted alpha-1,2-mannosidase